MRHCLTTYIAIWLTMLLTSCSKGNEGYDHDEAVRRVLEVQKIQNLNPGDPLAVPRMETIIDSMCASGKDACYFGAVNVLIDRLFSDGRYAEADSLAVRMLHDAEEAYDSISISMAKRVRAQIFFKLSQPERAMKEIVSAQGYISDPLRSGSDFGTATSIDEWIHIIARANADTASMASAGKRYADTVDLYISRNSPPDSTGHYQVTALAFKAENALLNAEISKARLLLDSASLLTVKTIPARAYEHFYEARSLMYASEGDYAASLADIDTLLNTHRCFPWFYLRDLRLKAEILNDAGLHAESAHTYSRYIAYHDSLSAKLTDRRLEDLTLLYRSELAREEKRTNTMRLLGMGSVTLMLLILLGLTYKNTLTERKRNRLLVERLHEFDRTSHNLIEKIAEQSQETEETSLISRLDRYMATEQPYCDPTLGRKELAEYLGISQDALAQLIRTEYDQTVHSYINFFRSEEVRRIIDSDSTETITEMAQRLGFGTPRTLQRAFKERFDMSPTQYREASASLRMPENQ